MPSRPKYRITQKYSGMTAIIINNGKVLLLKRRNIPVIMNPGIWAFLSGGRDGRERYIHTAYREIEEESGLKKDSLKLLYRKRRLVTDEGRRLCWYNWIFIFRSNTSKVKLDYENSAYRWATLRQIEKEINYTNVFINRREIERKIGEYIHG